MTCKLVLSILVLDLNETAMKQAVKELLAQKGYSPVFDAISKSVRDLKQAQYTRGEIRETLFDMFGKDDQKIIDFINQTI